MRCTPVLLVLFAPLLSALACGGRVDGVGDRRGGDAGEDRDRPSPACPAASEVVTGAACTAEGLTCSGPDVPGDCGDSFSQCTCENGVWGGCTFDGPTGCPPPVPACPPPSTISEGASCDRPMTCPSETVIYGCEGPMTGTLTCDCIEGSWTCERDAGQPCPETGLPDVVSPPAGCPPPNEVLAGVPCYAGAGVECPGNPQECDGAIFYDALECNGTQWFTLAATVCGASDGGPDGPVFDDAAAIDAGWWE